MIDLFFQISILILFQVLKKVINFIFRLTDNEDDLLNLWGGIQEGFKFCQQAAKLPWIVRLKALFNFVMHDICLFADFLKHRLDICQGHNSRGVCVLKKDPIEDPFITDSDSNCDFLEVLYHYFKGLFPKGVITDVPQLQEVLISLVRACNLSEKLFIISLNHQELFHISKLFNMALLFLLLPAAWQRARWNISSGYIAFLWSIRESLILILTIG